MLQIAFEQQRRGQPVYRFLPLFKRRARLPQHAFGFDGGQALIPKHNRQLEVRAEALGKVSGVFALTAFGPAHVERRADEQAGGVPLPGNLFQLLEILSNTRSFERCEALRSDPKLIANREPNPFLAYI